MKNAQLFLFILITATLHGLCADMPTSQSSTNDLTFRNPFTLKLHVDKERYYEQEFPKIPYVFQNDVYLFKDDEFGIDLGITNGIVKTISYQANTNKADVSFRFFQQVKDDGDAMMILVIENHTKHKLYMEALMTVPQGKRPRKTTILPVEPGLRGYESWPHPIVQLVLRNIRFSQERNEK